MLGKALRGLVAASAVGGLALVATPTVAASANTLPIGKNTTFRVTYSLWHRSGTSTVTITSLTPLRGGDTVGSFNTYDQALGFLGARAGTFDFSPRRDRTVFTFVSGWGMVFTNSTATGYATTPMGFHDGTLHAH
jgi:hypothetical protein